MVRAIVLTLAWTLGGCTALHWRDGRGVDRHLGLVWSSERVLPHGRIVSVRSLGASLNLIPGRVGWTLGYEHSVQEHAERRTVRSPDELRAVWDRVVAGETSAGERPIPGDAARAGDAPVVEWIRRVGLHVGRIGRNASFGVGYDQSRRLFLPDDPGSMALLRTSSARGEVESLLWLDVEIPPEPSD